MTLDPSAATPHAPAGTPTGTLTDTAAVARTVRLTRALAVGALLALIFLSLAWELWLAPLRPGGSWLVLKALPLCIPLAGLLKERMYTYRWLSLVVWLYFTEGTVRAFSDRAPSSWLALLEVLLCLVLFVACALHVRLRLRLARDRATVAPADASVH